MNLWFLLILIVIIGIIFYINSAKKDKATSSIPRIDLSLNSQSNKNPDNATQLKNKKSVQPVQPVQPKAKEEKLPDVFELKSKENKVVKQDKEHKEAVEKTKKVEKVVKTTTIKEIESVQENQKTQENLTDETTPAKPAYKLGIKKMDLFSKIKNYISNLAPQKINSNANESDSIPNQFKKDKNNTPSSKKPVHFEIAFYLKAQNGDIDSKALRESISYLGFKLLTTIGYHTNALIIQDEFAQIIDRLNIGDSRKMIKIYVDPERINNAEELASCIDIVSALAKNLNCEILNYKKTLMSDDDLALISQALFNG